MRFSNLPSKRPAGSFGVRSLCDSFLFVILSLVTIHCSLTTVVYAADPGVEFGAADDLSVMGMEGNAENVN